MRGGAASEAEAAAVPEAAVDAMHRTLFSFHDVETHLHHFLSMADPDVLAELSPLQRAQVFLVLAKTASTLFSVRLRCSGIPLEGHAFRAELERISLYEEKFQRYCDWSRAPLRPSTTTNYRRRPASLSILCLTLDQSKGKV